MSWMEVVMWAVVVGIGMPASIFNRTALALTLSWAVSQAAWLLTDDSLPIKLYILCDYSVILVIFSKDDAADCFPYRSFREQILAAWKERWPADRLVMTVFLMMWLVYVLPMGDAQRWRLLWGLAIAQFVVAGWEAFSFWRVTWRRKQKESQPPDQLRLGGAVHA